eukprot:NODE_52_length_30984_cov_1.383358.p2 type:complete len:637 gc:universal NODE_52_length_30984_cov_1.383358:14731-12821(-)
METLIIPLHLNQKKDFNKITEDLNRYEGICVYLNPVELNEKSQQNVHNLIKKLLSRMDHVTALEICGTTLTSKLLNQIEKIVVTKNLQLLSLPHTKLGNSLLMQYNDLSQLQVLNLSACHIGYEGIQHLVHLLLKSDQPFSRISLNGNDIRDIGLKYMLNYLSGRKEVKKWDLENCGLTNHSLRIIITYLSDNIGCSHINVKNNFINESNLEEIKKMTSLRKKYKSFDQLISPWHNTRNNLHLKLPYMYFDTKERPVTAPPRELKPEEVDMTAFGISNVEVDFQLQLEELHKALVFVNQLKGREDSLRDLTENLETLLNGLNRLVSNETPLVRESKIPPMKSRHKSTQTKMIDSKKTLYQKYIEKSKYLDGPEPYESPTRQFVENGSYNTTNVSGSFRKSKSKSIRESTSTSNSSTLSSIKSPSTSKENNLNLANEIVDIYASSSSVILNSNVKKSQSESKNSLSAIKSAIVSSKPKIENASSLSKSNSNHEKSFSIIQKYNDDFEDSPSEDKQKSRSRVTGSTRNHSLDPIPKLESTQSLNARVESIGIQKSAPSSRNSDLDISFLNLLKAKNPSEPKSLKSHSSDSNKALNHKIYGQTKSNHSLKKLDSKSESISSIKSGSFAWSNFVDNVAPK